MPLMTDLHYRKATKSVGWFSVVGRGGVQVQVELERSVERGAL